MGERLAVIFEHETDKMATRSRKDWLSPHKVSLLILIKYISSSDDEQEDYLDCLRRSRHKLSLLLLEFFEVPLFSSKLIDFALYTDSLWYFNLFFLDMKIMLMLIRPFFFSWVEAWSPFLASVF